MKSYIQTAILLLTLLGCGPKNEEVTNEQIETDSVTQGLDSIANVQKDAVRTDENDITPTLPMPQPVIAILSEKYPGWQQPALTESAAATAQEQPQDPTLIRGAFNEDNLQDYAIQFQLGTEVVVVALLQEDESTYTTHELMREKMVQQQDSLRSQISLQVLEKGNQLQTEKEKLTLPHETIGVRQPQQTIAYVYQNGRFTAHQVKL